MAEQRIICGINTVASAMDSGLRIHSLLCAGGRKNSRVQKLVEILQKQGVDMEEVERAALTKACGTDKHQGIAAYTDPLTRKDLTGLLSETPPGERFFLLLDEVTDPHNFGALIRSAAAAGCQAVIYARDRSCQVTPVVEKAAAGTLNCVALCQVTNLSRAIAELKHEGVWVYGLALEGASSIYATDLRGDVALVAGSEGRGIRPGVLKACDGAVKIFMPGRVESLNVSVATGVALFEVVRQRMQRGENRLSNKKSMENG
ncbi:MAG: 23S rRNA (guanosine(2251)-2'-O)-methyltransferase RlmB [Desulfuromonadaceae bacterium]|nr:23S rRNA (guanosine(2251)-2'-O)-methyltransferase RlmB [Geobacteraceae bacterium]